MTGARAFFGALRDEQSGAAIVEFALIAPVLAMTLMGLFELSHQFYVTSLIEGSLHHAARDNSIEGAKTVKLNKEVREAVQHAIPTATVKLKRIAYFDYSNVGKPEDFTDNNGNGKCDNGEPFEDVNGDNTWNKDQGRTDSNGGARDAVVYRVTVKYKRLFPVAGLLGFDNNVNIRREMVLRNQPYGAQARTVTMGTCP